MSSHRLQTSELQALNSLFSNFGIAYNAGDEILHESEPSYDLYIVLRGQVEFSVSDPESGVKRVLRVAHTGEIFGEISCFSGLPRTATAIALEETVLLKFQRDTAIELLRKSPDFAIKVIQTLSDRLRANTEMLARLWNQ